MCFMNNKSILLLMVTLIKLKEVYLMIKFSNENADNPLKK